MSETPRSDAAIADILASIRRIVADEERRGPDTTGGDDGVLVLTADMRVDVAPGGAHGATAMADRPADATRAEPDAAVPVEPAHAAPARAAEAARADPASARAEPHTVDARALLSGEPDPTPDEAAVAEIVRSVLRQEFSGAFGRNLTAQIRQLVQAEVTRALAAREQPKA